MYVEVEGSAARCDSITKSWYNTEFASVGLHIIQHAVNAGMSGANFGIITPYGAQIKVYSHALRRLHVQHPTAGYDKTIVGTTDTRRMQNCKMKFVLSNCWLEETDGGEVVTV